MTDTLRLDGFEYKGIPLGAELSAAQLASAGWNVANGDTATPVATLSRSALLGNAAAMRDWCDRRGVSLAPHAKTTLSPELVRIQMDHGAWGMTAALPRQVAVLWRFRVKRIILANEVTDPAAIRWLSEHLAEDPDRQLFVYADSVDTVAVLDAALIEGGARRPLDVLIELGYPGGRTGARSAAEGVRVADAVVDSPRLRLAGVAAYEGTIGTGREADLLRRIDAFLGDVGELADALTNRFEVAEPVVTAGGSLYFDRVAEILAPKGRARGARLVLRSGCYLIHDHGLYARGTPERSGVPGTPAFRPALSVWGRVVSTPEPGLALIDAGRRDLSHDAGLPAPIERWRRGDRLDLEGTGATVTALSDQHVFLAYPPGLDLRLGDLVRLGISHPCTTLDRWRTLLVTDDSETVTGVITTSF